MNNYIRIQIVISIIAFATTSCSSAEFTGASFKKQRKEAQKTIPPGTEFATGKSENNPRVFAFNPKISENRPEITVTTIIDNSNSMVPIQKKVSSAFGNVTAGLRGFNGNMSLFTTTNTIGFDKNSFKINEYATFEMDDKTIVVSMDELSQIPPEVSYKLVKKYEIVDPYTDTRNALSFDSKMTDDLFFAFTSDYTYAIQEVGALGSGDEQGICTLLRALKQQEKSDKFHIYLVASNENDVTSMETCTDFETKTVERTPMPSEDTTPCLPDDIDCQYVYESEFKTFSKEKINYSYRRTIRKLNYDSTLPAITYNGRIGWKQKRTKIEFKSKYKVRKISYRKILLNDNIPFEDSVVSNYAYDDEIGSCIGELEQSCQIEHLDLIDAPNGVSPGSCTYTCETKISPTKPKYITNWSPGACANKTRVQCDGPEFDLVRGSLAASDIPFCERFCVDMGKNLTRALENPPNTCSGFSSSCSSTQENFLRGKVTILDSGSPITSCGVTCVESTVSDSLSLAELDSCVGIPGDENGTVTRVCNTGEKAAAAADFGSAIKNCEYSCQQRIYSKSIETADFSSCSAGARSCATSESDLAIAGSRKPADYLDSCEFECGDNQSIPNCKMTSALADACEDNFDVMKTFCELPGGPELIQASCTIKSSTKTVESIVYETIEGPWTASALSEEDPAVQAGRVLEEAHGRNYFLTAFVYPDKDASCDPADNDSYTGSRDIFTGTQFEKIATYVGKSNAQIFPLCLDDYSESLEFVFDLVTKVVEKTYKIDFDSKTEQIISVHMIGKDGQKSEVLSTDYSTTAATIQFSDTVDILTAESVEIQIDPR